MEVSQAQDNRCIEERPCVLSSYTAAALLLVDQGRVVEANASAARLFGYESVDALCSGLEPERQFAVANDCPSEAILATFSRRDGTVFRAHLWPTEADVGRRLFTLVHTEDVRSAEDLSRIEEGTIAQFLEAVPVGIFVLRADGRPYYVNQRAVSILGRGIAPDADPSELAEIYQAYVRDSDQEYPQERMPIVRALQGEEAEVEDMVIDHPGGRIPLQVWGSPIRNEAGNVSYAIVAFQDIRERREAEMRAAILQEQMLALSREVGQAEVAAGVLHNVGNVLNSITVSADMIRSSHSAIDVERLSKVAALMDQPPQELAAFVSEDERCKLIPKFLEGIRDHVLRQKEAIGNEVDALLRSVEHAGAIVSSHQRFLKSRGLNVAVTIDAAIQEAIEMMQDLFASTGVELCCEIEGGAELECDKHQLLQILLNLLGNAADAVAEVERGSAIRIRSWQDDARCWVEITDNGVGIPAELQERIFSFGMTTKSDGNGYGLHSSAITASEMGGSLRCKSEGHDRGATFVLELPRRRSDASTPCVDSAT